MKFSKKTILLGLLILLLNVTAAHALLKGAPGGGGGGGGGPPTGAAGGDLSGSYPDPNVFSLGHVTTGFRDSNYGTVAGAGSPLYRNNAGGISGLTVDANNTTVQKFEAANMLSLISRQQIIDPAEYGAVCNAQQITGSATFTAGTNQITIPGHVWISADIGSSIIVNNGGYPAGSGEATITGIGPSGAYAIISNNVTGNSDPVSHGWVTWGHDDSSMISNALQFSAPLFGAYLKAPNNCFLHDVNWPSGTSIIGYAGTRNYQGSGGLPSNPIVELPIWFYLGSGFTDGTSQFMLVTQFSGNDYIKGVMLMGTIFPFGTEYTGKRGTFIGSTVGNKAAASVDGTVIDTVTLSNLWNGFGSAYGSLNSGFFTGFVRNSEFHNMGWGMQGKFQDFGWDHNVFTGAFAWAAIDFESSNALRGYGNRYEEQYGGVNATTDPITFGAVTLNNSVLVHIEGDECQFGLGACLYLSGTWSGVTWTGGMMEGNGVAYTGANTGFNSHIIIANPNVSSGGSYYSGLSLDNVMFSKLNFSAGGSTKYIISSQASLAGGSVSIKGGIACANGYATAMFNWAGAPPTSLTVDTSDCPQTRTGQSDVSWNGAGALGLVTSAPKAGLIFDALNATSSTNSAIGLPSHTTANRPTTPLTGMFALNLTASAPEIYDQGQWNILPSVTTGAPAPNYNLQSTTTGGFGAAWVISNGVTWPTSGNLVLSNGTNSPAGITEIDGDCAVGVGGVWTAASCAGTASQTLGVSTTAASPQATGDATTGFFSPGASTVGVVNNGIISQEWGTVASGVNYWVMKPGATGVAPAATVGGTDTAGAGLGMKFTALTATATGVGGGVSFTSGDGFGGTGVGGALSFTSGNGSSTGGNNAAAGGAISFTTGNGVANVNKAGALTFTIGTTNNNNAPAMTFNGGSIAGNFAGGNITLNAGATSGNGNGGGIVINGGANTASSSTAAGGPILLTAGAASTAASGGSITLTATNGTGTNRNGGNVTIIAGTRTGTGTAGTITLKTAASIVAANFDGNQHHTYGGSAPALTSCGTSPSIDANANDSSGTVTAGSAATSCTITFATAYATYNHCRVSSQSVLTALTYSYSLSAITVAATALTGNIDYACDGM